MKLKHTLLAHDRRTGKRWRMVYYHDNHDKAREMLLLRILAGHRIEKH